jgi:chromosome segregation ATPase
MSEERLVACGRKLATLKSTKEDLERSLTAVNNEITQLTQQIIPELMAAMDISRLSIEGLGTLFKRSEVHAYVLAERREEFHQWLRENGHEDLIKETVHPKTLKAFATEQLTDGNPLPECVTATIIPTATLRRK